MKDIATRKREYLAKLSRLKGIMPREHIEAYRRYVEGVSLSSPDATDTAAIACLSAFEVEACRRAGVDVTGYAKNKQEAQHRKRLRRGEE